MGADRYTLEDLLAAGFEKAAQWQLNGDALDYARLSDARSDVGAAFEVDNSLYAFVSGAEVLYIGKTARSLTRRLQGYRRPGSTQRTNVKCHANIREAVARGERIEILVFAPPADQCYRGLEINLAAGLEDTLIRRFDPPWNGRAKSAPVSESAELEIHELDKLTAADEDDRQGPEKGRFTVRLGPTYFSQGIVNPGVAASLLLGSENDRLTVRFSDGTPSISTRIDRSANGNGSVRFVGSNQAIADWFQKRYRLGESVEARVLSPNLVEFLA